MTGLHRILLFGGLAMLMGSWSPSPTRGAAPAATSYVEIERAIQDIRDQWSKPGVPAEPNLPGWNQFFDALKNDLQSYSKAANENERLIALNKIYVMSQALGTSGWNRGIAINQSLREWLRPRVRLAWAIRQLAETVAQFPGSGTPTDQANRQRWIDFTESDLGGALRAYEQATTVAQRLSSLDRVRDALKVLNTNNTQHPWLASQNLEQAVNNLYNQPNLDVTVDVPTVTPLFNANLVNTGPVERKGYISQVTAGPKTGFGLMPSDNSIAFYNSQVFTSVTPVWDFQNQIAADPQGQRAAKLYQFSATSMDQAELTVITQITTNGLQLTPQYTHSINAQICSSPTQGGGFGRTVASLIGMNQNKINQKVYEGALPKFQQQIPAEAMEEAQQRIGAEAYQRNSTLFWHYLKGNNTLDVNDKVRITELSLRSRPEAAYIGGLLQWQTATLRGADAPQPGQFSAAEPGITADIHISSILSSLVEAAYQRPDVTEVKNFMVVTKNVPAGAPAKDGFEVTKNVDFSTYEKVAETARAAKDPKVTAIRITKPSKAPAFSADARGNLVAILKDVEFDLLVPEGSDRVTGIKAKFFKIQMPEVEVALSYELKPAAVAGEPPRVSARVVEFTPSNNSKIVAVTEGNKEQTLAQFTKVLVLAGIAGKLRSIPIDAPLANLDLKGFDIRSASKPHPTGWVRVNLVKTEPLPVAPIAPPPPTSPPSAPEPTPAPAPVSAVQPVDGTATATTGAAQ